MALFICTRKPRLMWISPLVVDPGHAEDDRPFRLGHPLQDLRLLVAGPLRQHRGERRVDLGDCLQELRLAWVLPLYFAKYSFDVAHGGVTPFIVMVPVAT